jgi:pyruvate formate lyase activating enzyme
VKSVAVTAGYMHAEARRELYQHIDAANVDLKAFTEEFYAKVCAGHLEPVKDTLRYLVRETSVWTEITTLLIPGQNDGDDEIQRLSDWVLTELGPDVPLHFTAFHPDYRMLDVPATPYATVRRARELARRTGLHHVYTGNVHDAEGGTTYCTGCGTPLIERDWYEIRRYELDASGACPKCHKAAAGRYEAAHGHFGRRRMPVVIGA